MERAESRPLRLRHRPGVLPTAAAARAGRGQLADVFAGRQTDRLHVRPTRAATYLRDVRGRWRGDAPFALHVRRAGLLHLARLVADGVAGRVSRPFAGRTPADHGRRRVAAGGHGAPVDRGRLERGPELGAGRATPGLRRRARGAAGTVCYGRSERPDPAARPGRTAAFARLVTDAVQRVGAFGSR